MLRADLIFLSYPKSGRTWFRYFWSRYLLAADLNVEPIIVFTHDHFDNIFDEQELPNTISRASFSECYRTVPTVMLVRDPRDVCVSFYWQITKREESWLGTFEEFVRHPGYGIERQSRFVLTMLEKAAPESVFSYEMMLDSEARARASFLEIVNRAGAAGLEGPFDFAFEEARFENMQLHEIALSQSGEKSEKLRIGCLEWDGDFNRLKCRGGRVNSWLIEFDERFDVQEFPIMAQLLATLFNNEGIAL